MFLKGHSQFFFHIAKAFKRHSPFSSFLVGKGWWEEENVLSVSVKHSHLYLFASVATIIFNPMGTSKL